MQREQVELQGIQFPVTVREDGASIEIVELRSSRNLDQWASENHFGSERPWGIISSAKSKEESFFLALSFRRVNRTRFKMQSGRLSKQQEEVTEPEVGELHLRRDGALEFYSVPAKQRNMIFQSLEESFSKESLSSLTISKQSMLSLMEDAIEVSSVSLTGIGNPFFSDVTLSGSDPANSRTFKELLPQATIKSFRAKFQVDSENEEQSSIMITISNNCKLRFYGGQGVLSQSDVEDYVSKVRKVATKSEQL